MQFIIDIEQMKNFQIRVYTDFEVVVFCVKCGGHIHKGSMEIDSVHDAILLIASHSHAS